MRIFEKIIASSWRRAGIRRNYLDIVGNYITRNFQYIASERNTVPAFLDTFIIDLKQITHLLKFCCYGLVNFVFFFFIYRNVGRVFDQSKRVIEKT